MENIFRLLHILIAILYTSWQISRLNISSGYLETFIRQ